MKNGKTKRRLRSFITWTFWVLLAQLVLINISAALYAHKLTHLQLATPQTSQEPTSRNIFAKTWRLFSGPTFYRQPLTHLPAFTHVAIQLKTKKNISIDGWYSKTDSLLKGTVILIHGLTGNKGQILDVATAFRNGGYNVLLLDVRGHGNSGGNVTTIGFRESEEVKLAYDHLKQGGEKNIFLWGSSMGAVIILKAVSDYQLQPSGIIVEMPFLSLQSHLKGRARELGFPEQPFGFLTTFWIGAENGFNAFNFKTTRYARDIQCPVLQQCGEKDQLVLKAETTAIYDAISSPDKKLVIYDNAAHELLFRKDPVIWTREVEDFLMRASKPIF